MADQFITDLDEVTSFSDSDLSVNETSPAGSPETNKMTRANILSQYLLRTNYQITRTVSSNNLTVAIKDADGNDATSSKPISFQIGGFIRKLTSTLSVTVNAGVSVFNVGASEFLNQAQDLFVYIGWRASTSSVFVVLARFPSAPNFSYFSGIATNEKYGAYSGAAPAASDAVEVIGRVNVQNSGTASFNWSVPLPNVVIQRPIYHTDWLRWAPTQTGFSSAPTLVAQYKLDWDTVFWALNPSNTGTSNLTTLTMSLPWTAAALSGMNNWSVGRGQDNAVEVSPTFRIVQNTSTLDAYKGPGNTAWTASGTKFVGGQGFYRMA